MVACFSMSNRSQSLDVWQSDECVNRQLGSQRAQNASARNELRWKTVSTGTAESIRCKRVASRRRSATGRCTEGEPGSLGIRQILSGSVSLSLLTNATPRRYATSARSYQLPHASLIGRGAHWISAAPINGDNHFPIELDDASLAARGAVPRRRMPASAIDARGYPDECFWPPPHVDVRRVPLDERGEAAAVFLPSPTKCEREKIKSVSCELATVEKCAEAVGTGHKRARVWNYPLFQSESDVCAD